MTPLSIYIHIPYCESKCIYCDFYSVINSKNVELYFNALLKEIEKRANEFSANRKVISIYFGGGTPSLIKVTLIEKILNSIFKKFHISETPEITIEANPGTLNRNKIGNLIEIGINRLSIGVQSFFDDDLQFLTRIHDSATAIKTVETANKFGFENINIDLIFNLPGQSKERWGKNLETAIKLPVKHISAYSLIVEKGTILSKMISDGKIEIGDNDFDADLYEFTQSYLAANNFKQYEVSNFAKKGYECKHNISYWNYTDYLGFGVSAHSFLRPKRWHNYSSLTFYLKSLENNHPFIANEENLSVSEQLEEYVMLGLRSNGIEKSKLIKLFGEKFLIENRNLLFELNRNNFLQEENGFIKFTRKGYQLCDEILLKFRYK